MKEVRDKNRETAGKGFSLRLNILAWVMVLAFTFQSLSSFNAHSYSTSGISIHIDNTCMVTEHTFMTHLTYYCNEFHEF